MADIPYDHPLGRCIFVPVTKSWAELGQHLVDIGAEKQNMWKGMTELAAPRPHGYNLFKTFTDAEKKASFGNNKLFNLYSDWESKGYGEDFMRALVTTDPDKQWFVPKSFKVMQGWKPIVVKPVIKPVKPVVLPELIPIDWEGAGFENMNVKQKPLKFLLPGNERINFILDDLKNISGMNFKKAEEIADSLRGYTAKDFSHIRNAQVKNLVTSSYFKSANNIEMYIKNAPKYSGEVAYRGIKVNGDVLSDFFKLDIGMDIDMKGISSWSSLEDLPFFKEGNVRFKVVNPKSGVDLSFINPGGREILFSNDVNFKILGKEVDDKGVTFLVEEKLKSQIKSEKIAKKAEDLIVKFPSEVPKPVIPSELKFVDWEDAGFKNIGNKRGHMDFIPGYGDRRSNLILKDLSGEGIDIIRAREIANSLEHYIATDYGYIREAQVKNLVTSKYFQDANNIEMYIKNAPKFEGEVYRGVGNLSKEKLGYFETIKNDEVINMKGLSSWSTDMDTTQIKYGQVIFRLPKSESGVSVAFSNMIDPEVLFSKDIKFKVTGKVKIGDKLFVDVKEILEPVKIAKKAEDLIVKLPPEVPKPVIPKWQPFEKQKFVSGLNEYGGDPINEIIETFGSAGKKINREKAEDYFAAVRSWVAENNVPIRIYQSSGEGALRKFIENELRKSKVPVRLLKEKIEVGVKDVISSSKLLEKYIESVPKFLPDSTVFRGIREGGELVTKEQKEAFFNNFRNLKQGQIIDMNGASSWTTEKEVADKYGKGRIRFSLSGNKSGVPINNLSSVISENEVVFSKNARYRVLKVIDEGIPSNPKIRVEVEEVFDVSKVAEKVPVPTVVKVKPTIEEVMKTGDYKVVKVMSEGVNKPELVEYKEGTKAILKKSWKGDIQSIKNEKNVYEIAKSMGYDNVPVTILKEIEKIPYSVQKFVGGAEIAENIDFSKWNFAARTNATIEEAKMNLFDSLICSADRHSGNYLVDNTGKYYWIDNGYSLGTDPAKREFSIGIANNFVSDAFEKIGGFGKGELREKSKKMVEDFLSRIDKIDFSGLEGVDIDKFKNHVNFVRDLIEKKYKEMV